MDNTFSGFKPYSRISNDEKEVCLAKPYVEGARLNEGVWIQAGYVNDGAPKQGDMIAIYQQTGRAQFLVEAEYWEEAGYKLVDET